MELLNWALVALYVGLACVAAGHALLNKHDSRSALGWIAVSLMFPFAGPLAYFLFGVNRVQTRAKELDKRSRFQLRLDYEQSAHQSEQARLSLELPAPLRQLARISSTVTRQPLTAGNRIEPLHNGEQAYPAMLEAIEQAQHSVFLTTYIFDTNSTGQKFIDALARAARRGVDVRVMLDGVGEWYSYPKAGPLLKARGVPVARFLPPKLLPPSLHINLRNHRKILVVDGRIGFTGGMNIGDRHLSEWLQNEARVVDLHFRLTGPIVTQMEQVFLTDWRFVTGKHTELEPVSGDGTGSAMCRTIVNGPNEDFEKLTVILIGAVSLAYRQIVIVTPYFLPAQELIAALRTAALRGVEVLVILPARNNLPFVHWATRSMLWQLLEWEIKIYYQPPPFVHTKLFLVDGHYAQIGSANLDPRSLRLNFELVIEVYDKGSLAVLCSYVEAIRQRSHEVSLEELDGRPLPAKFRDALAWLFSPYL